MVDASRGVEPPLDLKAMSPFHGPGNGIRQNMVPLVSVSKPPFWPAGNDTLPTYEPPGGKPLDPTDNPDSSVMPGVPQDPDVPGSGNPGSPFEPEAPKNSGPEDLPNTPGTGAVDELTGVGAEQDALTKIGHYISPPNPDPSMLGAVDALLSSNQWSDVPALPIGEFESIDFSAVFTHGSSGVPNGNNAAPFEPSQIDEFSGEASPPIAYGAAVCYTGSSSRRTTK